MVWGKGLIGVNIGALDFAGGTVVHISSGVAAVVAAWVIVLEDPTRSPCCTHNVPYVLLGIGLLWFGWFGFNAGSALAADGLAAVAFVGTAILAVRVALCG